MARKSSIERLPPKIRTAIDAELTANRLTLDEILERISKEFGAGNMPSRSALGRRKQRLDKILAKHRQTNEIMTALVAHIGEGDASEMSRGVIELLRVAIHDVAGDIAADEAPDAKAVGALALAMQRLAGAEEITLKVKERVRAQALAESADSAEAAAIEMGLTADRAAQIRQRVLNGQV